MNALARLGSHAAAVALVACASVSPDPARMADDLPPPKKLDPQTLERVADEVGQAVAAVAAEHWPAARRHARAALAGDPRNALARAALGRCLMVDARVEDPPALYPWREAEGEFRRAERLAPLDPVVALWHALFLTEDGHRAAAIQRLEPVLEAWPEDARVLRELSRLHYDRGDEARAIELLVRYLALVPDDRRASYELAFCYLDRARGATDSAERESLWERATASFERYVERAPEDAAGFRGLAQARFELARARRVELDEAVLAPILDAFERAARLDPESPEPEFGRGFALETAGDHDAARAAYRSALARDPEHLGSLLNLAASFADAGDAAEARALARRALALGRGLTETERQRLEEYVAGR